jgi:endonuclease YncB( thermonuclease family)
MLVKPEISIMSPDFIIKKICLIITVVITWSFNVSNVSAWTGKVVGTVDGDSLKIFRPGHGEVETRLYGIDAPEFNQAFGRVAKKHLASLLFGQQVEVETLDQDGYGRPVVIIWKSDLNANEKIVRDGYAWVYKRYCKKPFCEDWLMLESNAREEKLGLWQQVQPVPPWDFRHNEVR